MCEGLSLAAWPALALEGDRPLRREVEKRRGRLRRPARGLSPFVADCPGVGRVHEEQLIERPLLDERVLHQARLLFEVRAVRVALGQSRGHCA